MRTLLSDRANGINQRSELKSLTSLRGLAAMAVVLQHFSATAQASSRTIIPSLVPHGYVAVDFFFVLSGFIMAYTYVDSFRSRGLRAYGPFLTKRIARIVPLNTAILGAILVAGACSSLLLGQNIFFASSNPVFDFIANLLMLQGVGIGRNLNGPSWSISAEFSAYFLFPLFFAAMFHSRRMAWTSALLAVSTLSAIALTHPRLGLSFEAPPASLLRCFSEFAFGMIAYNLYSSPKTASFLGRDHITIGLCILSLTTLIFRCDLFAALLFPFIVVAFAANTGLASRIIQIRPIYFLGMISFSLYLIHNIFRPAELKLFQHVMGAPVGKITALSFALIGSFSVIPFAWVAYETVEKPGRHWMRKLFGRRETIAR